MGSKKLLSRAAAGLLSLLLALGSITAGSVGAFAAETSVDGILICANCQKAGVVAHTVKCTLMESCIASGYGVLVPQADKTYKFYALDDKGDAAALALLQGLQAKGVTNYVSVKVTGNFADVAGTYDYTFGGKTSTMSYDGTISNASLTYDATHGGFAAKAVNFPATVKVEYPAACRYTGSAITPDVVVTDGSYTLKRGFDYLIAYENNTEVGTATLKLTGVGAYYKGELTKTFQIQQMTFADVAADAYYADAVKWAVNHGVTNGTGTDTFGPGQTVTRGQLVTFLWRAAGSPKAEKAENPFADVAADAYYYDAVLWAVEQGITDGVSATSFAPDNGVTRGQAVTFLWRSQKSPTVSGTHSFADVAADAYYYNAALWAVEQGITKGTADGTFSPDSLSDRGQVVTFLYRCNP